jgi:hypothetical protein
MPKTMDGHHIVVVGASAGVEATRTVAAGLE